MLEKTINLLKTGNPRIDNLQLFLLIVGVIAFFFLILGIIRWLRDSKRGSPIVYGKGLAGCGCITLVIALIVWLLLILRIIYKNL